MDKPFAITLDVGSSLANKTGSWRTERPMSSWNRSARLSRRLRSKPPRSLPIDSRKRRADSRSGRRSSPGT